MGWGFEVGEASRNCWILCSNLNCHFKKKYEKTNHNGSGIWNFRRKVDMGCIMFERRIWACSLFPGFHFFIDSLVAMEKAMKRDNINVNDRQLACARINSPEGQDYLKGMAAAANYAWVNRSSMTFLCRQVNIGTIMKINKTFSNIEKLWICLFLANKKMVFLVLF